MEYQWVPAHEGIEGNEEAGQQTIKVAYKYCGKYTETRNPPPFFHYASISHINQRLTEVEWEESKKEIQQIGKKSVWTGWTYTTPEKMTLRDT